MLDTSNQTPARIEGSADIVHALKTAIKLRDQDEQPQGAKAEDYESLPVEWRPGWTLTSAQKRLRTLLAGKAERERKAAEAQVDEREGEAQLERNEQSASHKGKAREPTTSSGAPGIAATGSSSTLEAAIATLTLQVTNLAASTDRRVTALQQDLATLSSTQHVQRTSQRPSHADVSRIERLQGAAPSECDDLDNATLVEGRLPGDLDRATSAESRLIREYLPYVKRSVIESIVLETFRAEELVKLTRSFKTTRTVHKIGSLKLTTSDDLAGFWQGEDEFSCPPLMLRSFPNLAVLMEAFGAYIVARSLLDQSGQVAAALNAFLVRFVILAKDFAWPACLRYFFDFFHKRLQDDSFVPQRWCDMDLQLHRSCLRAKDTVSSLDYGFRSSLLALNRFRFRAESFRGIK